MIVDTDLGGDPDDAVALIAAAVAVPSLALVLTCDEVDGERARLARFLLDLAGRPDVPVVAGQAATGRPVFCADNLVPARVTRQPHDVVAAVETIFAGAGPVRWVGMGSMSNLARVLVHRPDLAQQTILTQMGGAVTYRDPQRAEHNVRLDPRAARDVLATVHSPRLVTSDVTFRPEMELGPESTVYRRLTDPDAPPWAPVLRAHLDQWFARYHPSSMQHDALTLSAALHLPFVEFARRDIRFDEAGRMSVVEDGIEAYVSQRAHYPAFRQWLELQLAAPVNTAQANRMTQRERPLDAGQWRLVAEAGIKEGSAPLTGDPDQDAARKRSFARAITAFDEILALIPDGADAVPASAFWTPQGRAAHDQNPGHFRRDYLERWRRTFRHEMQDRFSEQ